MISSEVQRTLVKSPPELWAELSDPAALARHLGELGEIRIIRTEPESTVEWAAENTTGVVAIKPSGWGTKVTLSVTRNLVEPEPADMTAVPETPPGEPRSQTHCPPPAADSTAESRVQATGSAAAHDEGEPAGATVQDQLEVGLAAASAGEVPTTSEGEAPVASAGKMAAPDEDGTPATTHVETAAVAEPATEPESRRGFFARLFSRRRRSAVSAVPVASADARPANEPDAFAAVTQALTPESIAETHPFAVPAPVAPAPAASAPAAAVPAPPAPTVPAVSASAPAPKPPAAISAELMAAEEVTAAHVTAEEVTAVLTAVLDRLGAAHHRPFSRA
jgi:hypothetical protein